MHGDDLQGPFSRSDILDWFEARFFPADLPIRPAGNPRPEAFRPLIAMIKLWAAGAVHASLQPDQPVHPVHVMDPIAPLPQPSSEPVQKASTLEILLHQATANLGQPSHKAPHLERSQQFNPHSSQQSYLASGFQGLFPLPQLQLPQSQFGAPSTSANSTGPLEAPEADGSSRNSANSFAFHRERVSSVATPHGFPFVHNVGPSLGSQIPPMTVSILPRKLRIICFCFAWVSCMLGP